MCLDPESEIEVIVSADDRTISATCQTHGSKGFCNLRVTKIDGEIVLNPHVGGFYVLRLDEVAATQLFIFLGSGWDDLVPAISERSGHPLRLLAPWSGACRVRGGVHAQTAHLRTREVPR